MWLLTAVLTLATAFAAAESEITSIAGAGPDRHDLVRGRQAIDAVLGEVHALAFDGENGLLAGAQRMLVRVDADGMAHPVAGTGTLGADGVVGDRVAAQTAPVAYIRGVAQATDGSVYFSDAALHTVRRIGPDGFVTTIVPASSGYISPRALVFDAAGNLYIAVLGRREEERLRGAILKVTPGGDIAPLALRSSDGMLASLQQPEGLTIDSSGALYVTEFGGHRVLRIAGGIVTTVAGTGIAGLSGDGEQATEAQLRGPSSVAVAGDETLYVSDTLNNRIRVVLPNGLIRTMEWMTPDGDVSFTLSAPAHVLLDPVSQALYVAEYFGYSVRKIEAGRISTLAGSGERLGWSSGAGDGGPALLARLNAPEGIAMCAGRLYVADTSHSLIRLITPDGWIDSVAGNGLIQDSTSDGGPARETSIGLPSAVACNTHGNIYIADRGRPRIHKAAADGSIAMIFGDGSHNNPIMRDPRGVAADSSGNVFVTERVHSRVLNITPDGYHDVLWSGRPEVDYPYAIALDSEDRPVFSVNTANASRVYRVGPGGAVEHVAGSGECENGLDAAAMPALRAGLCFVSGLAFDGRGSLYLSTFQRIARIDTDGTLRWIAGTRDDGVTPPPPLGDGGPPSAANVNGVSSIAVDEEGVYFTQLVHNRVRKIRF